MDTPTDEQLFEAIRRGDNQAFESIYDRYQQRGRLAAWRISHRPDWVDEILNESWCRAFKARTSYNGSRPFLVWFGGILQNVYREQCRKSPTTIGHPADGPAVRPGNTLGSSDRLNSCSWASSSR